MVISSIFQPRTRILWLLVGVSAALCVAVGAPLLWAQTDSQAGAGANNGRQAALREQLMIGLKARTKADRAFVDLVVARVEQGKLPRKLVDSTFLWARKRAAKRRGAHKLRAMVYFRPALILRAKQLGYQL